MKADSKFFIPLLVALIILAASPVPTYACEDQLSVSIEDYNVKDIDGDGTEDLQLIGKAELTLDDPCGNGKVIIVLSLHLEHEDGSSRIITQTLHVNLNEGETTISFVFTAFNLKAGDYLAYLTASCRGLHAESEPVSIDPPGGTVGPI